MLLASPVPSGGATARGVCCIAGPTFAPMIPRFGGRRQSAAPVCEDSAVRRAVEGPLPCHERHDRGLDSPAEADWTLEGRASIFPPGVVVRTRGVVLLRRGLRVSGGVFDDQGEEAAKPLLGVGSGIGDDPDLPDLKWGSTRSLRFLPAVLILHIALLLRSGRRAAGLSLQVGGWGLPGADGRGERRAASMLTQAPPLRLRGRGEPVSP